MADKLIVDLDQATLSLTHSIEVDRADLTETQQATIQELLTYIQSLYIYTTTFVVGDTDGTPNWDININHALNYAYVSVTLWDGSGNEKSTSGIVSIVDADNVRLRLHVAITGTWKVKVSKF